MASIRSQLLSAVFYHMTNDEQLRSYFNLAPENSENTSEELMRERIYYMSIDSEIVHPYIVYGLDDKGGSTYRDYFITECRLFIDIWDYKPNHIRIDAIQDRITKLFNRRECQLETGRASLWLETMFESPVQAASGDVEPDLGRYTVAFKVRLIDGSMVNAILDK